MAPKKEPPKEYNSVKFTTRNAPGLHVAEVIASTVAAIDNADDVVMADVDGASTKIEFSVSAHLKSITISFHSPRIRLTLSIVACLCSSGRRRRPTSACLDPWSARSSNRPWLFGVLLKGREIGVFRAVCESPCWSRRAKRE